MDDQRSLEEQLLGDMTYDDPRAHRTQPADSGPEPDPAVILGDMSEDLSAPASAPAYQRLTDEQIATLQQQRAAKGEKPYTAEEIEDLQAEFIERQRRQAQEEAMAKEEAARAAAAASILVEDTEYVAPEKKTHEELPTVDASALLEEPAPQPERRAVFNSEDLEAAKRAAVKRQREALEDSGPKTEQEQRESRRQMEILRHQQLADKAQAGFKLAIICTVVGVIGAGLMALFSTRPFPEDSPAFFNFAQNFYLIAGFILVLLSFTIVTRVKQLKGFTSFLFGISAVLLLIPGVLVLFEMRGTEMFWLSAVSYLGAIGGCFAVTFMLSTSDKIKAYYDRCDELYD